MSLVLVLYVYTDVYIPACKAYQQKSNTERRAIEVFTIQCFGVDHKVLLSIDHVLSKYSHIQIRRFLL